MIQVKQGDNLYQIAKANGVTVAEIMEANGLKNNDIKVGQMLKIPVKGIQTNEPLIITVEDYLMDPSRWFDLSRELQANAVVTVNRTNRLLAYYNESNQTGFKTKLNDGYRPPFSPYGSKLSTHRIAKGIDMDDNEAGDFWRWIYAHLYLCKEIGLWLEHVCWTHYYDPVTKTWKSWVHLQTVAPESGLRVFIPNDLPNPNPGFWNGVYDSSLNGFI